MEVVQRESKNTEAASAEDAQPDALTAAEHMLADTE
jgi:hypothetical protein